LIKKQIAQSVGIRRRLAGRGHERARGRVSSRMAAVGGGGGTAWLVVLLSGTAVTPTVIIWGSVVLFVVLAVAAVSWWAYVFGDETVSGRVWRLLLCVTAGRSGHPVQEPACVTVPSQGARKAGPGSAVARPVAHSCVLTPAGSRGIRPGRLAGRAGARPAVPPQRFGPERHPPRAAVHRARRARAALRR
jgi:hypothetical protein